jgi:hypothetical protein
MNIEVDQNYIADLHDDFFMNKNKDLYQFINDDLTTAFFLGVNVETWFKEIDKEQQYLVSKQIRHNKDFVVPYEEQINYWIQHYRGEDNVYKLAKYVIENLFYTSEEDKVKIAFYFGQVTSAAISKEDMKTEPLWHKEIPVSKNKYSDEYLLCGCSDSKIEYVVGYYDYINNEWHIDFETPCDLDDIYWTELPKPPIKTK